MTVQTICISYRYVGNDAVLFKDRPATVTNAFTCRNMANLENSGFQCADIRKHLIISWVYAMEAKTKATHIHLAFREMLDTCRIADMTKNLMFKGIL